MNRRGFLKGGLIGASALTLTGCKVLDGTRDTESGLRGFMEGANRLTYRAQRLLQGNGALAPEYTQADIRQAQHPNGSTNPDGADYTAMAANGFADYALTVNGLVDNPLTLSRNVLTAIPSRTQIARHDCVEGWSCIAKWTGVPLSLVLDQARPTSAAKYVVFNCYDAIERGLSGVVTYYESIDMTDARHPQTILAYGMNDAALPVANGGPLRVRIERQLGYKMAKYIHTITLVPDLAGYGRGKGGYWEDRGYEWYAGI